MGEKEPVGQGMVYPPSEKFSKFFYWKISGPSKYTEPIKQLWEHNLGIELNMDDWPAAQVFPFRSVSATKLCMFQYRVVQKALLTNVR